MTCSTCGGSPIEAEGKCASCRYEERKAERLARKPAKPYKKIAQVSTKRRSQILDYSIEKAIFLIGKKCPVYPDLKVEDIHHQKGRVGYADQWAKDNGITLIMDKRFWLAVSRKGHVWIELHPTEARKKGWSLPRLALEETKTK